MKSRKKQIHKPCNGSWAYVTARVSHGTDQLSVAVKAMEEEKLKGNTSLLL